MRMKFRYEISFSADLAWEITGDFSRADWIGGIKNPPLMSGQGIGMTRTFEWGHLNAPSVHRLDLHDPARRLLVFTVVDTPLSILLNAEVSLHLVTTPINTSKLYVSVVLPNMYACYREDIYHTTREWGESCVKRIETILSERNQMAAKSGTPGFD